MPGKVSDGFTGVYTVEGGVPHKGLSRVAPLVSDKLGLETSIGR